VAATMNRSASSNHISASSGAPQRCSPPAPLLSPPVPLLPPAAADRRQRFHGQQQQQQQPAEQDRGSPSGLSTEAAASATSPPAAAADMAATAVAQPCSQLRQGTLLSPQQHLRNILGMLGAAAARMQPNGGSQQQQRRPRQQQESRTCRRPSTRDGSSDGPPPATAAAAHLPGAPSLRAEGQVQPEEHHRADGTCQSWMRRWRWAACRAKFKLHLKAFSRKVVRGPVLLPCQWQQQQPGQPGGGRGAGSSPSATAAAAVSAAAPSRGGPTVAALRSWQTAAAAALCRRLGRVLSGPEGLRRGWGGRGLGRKGVTLLCDCLQVKQEGSAAAAWLPGLPDSS